MDPRLVNGKLTLQGESPWQVRGATAWGPRAQKKEVMPVLGGKGRRVLKALMEEWNRPTLLTVWK